jgi:hypothetical protein
MLGKLGGAAVAVASFLLMAGTVVPAYGSAATWSVKPGGKVSGSSPEVALTDTGTHQSFVCNTVPPSPTAFVKMTFKTGSGLRGSEIGKVTSLTFARGCPFKVKDAGLPWKLSALSYDKAKGLTSGTISGIHVSISSPDFPCTAELDGTGTAKHNGEVDFTYSNKTHKLTALAAGGNLHFYKASCPGVFKSGDKATFSGAYHLKPALTIAGR